MGLQYLYYKYPCIVYFLIQAVCSIVKKPSSILLFSVSICPKWKAQLQFYS